MESLGPSGIGDARIFLVDDEVLVRNGLRMLISLQPGLTVCGEAEDAPEALARIHALKPDLAVIDLSLRSSSGIQLVRRLRRELPALRTLVLSLHDEPAVIAKALRAGAHGYVTKDEGADRVVEAIGVVLQGRRYLSERLAARLREARRKVDPPRPA
jgi:DNA-binding NarL/FixJ family response regulator